MTDKTFTIEFFTKSDARAKATVTAPTKAEAIAKVDNVGQIMNVIEHSPVKPVQTCKVKVMDWNGNIIEIDAIC